MAARKAASIVATAPSPRRRQPRISLPRSVRNLTAQRARLVDQVVHELRDLIISGKLLPGTQMVQKDLAERLGVSRTPLREAFRVLELDGIVRVSNKNRTIKVAEFSNDEIRELYEIREVIDGLASRLAAASGLPGKIETQLQSLAREMVEAAQPLDIKRFVTAHVEFHTLLLKGSGNERLVMFEQIVRISAQMLYPRLASQPARMVASAKEHLEILEAIRAGDPLPAERVSRSHVGHALESWAPAHASRVTRKARG